MVASERVRAHQQLASALDKFIRARSTEILNPARFIAQAHEFLQQIGLPFALHPDPNNGQDIYDLLFDQVARYHPTEIVYRDALINEMLNETKSREDDVAFCELPLKGVRADFIRVNGSSKIYEIKSEYDTLSRCAKQQEAYSLICEYVTVVAHERHLKRLEVLIPMHCGLTIVSHIPGELPAFQIVRKAAQHDYICADIQARALTAAELRSSLKAAGQAIPDDRAKLEQAICELGSSQVNEEFKRHLKARKRKTWTRFCSRHEHLPKLVTDYFFRYWLSDTIYNYFQDNRYAAPSASAAGSKPRFSIMYAK